MVERFRIQGLGFRVYGNDLFRAPGGAGQLRIPTGDGRRDSAPGMVPQTPTPWMRLAGFRV